MFHTAALASNGMLNLVLLKLIGPVFEPFSSLSFVPGSSRLDTWTAVGAPQARAAAILRILPPLFNKEFINGKAFTQRSSLLWPGNCLLWSKKGPRSQPEEPAVSGLTRLCEKCP